ncbi:hypothetical protein DAMA08_025350 [Martiniozyma asiatica (nom. inval.)]|nr:hypothetical protein DAMA08_025350 [Martiniozyma asiatica]
MSEKLIISFPLYYQFFLKPFNTVYESVIASDWRLNDTTSYTTNDNSFFSQFAPNSLIFDNLGDLRSAINHTNKSYASYGILSILNEFRLSESKLTISIIGDSHYQNEMNDIRLKFLQTYNSIKKCNIIIDPINNKECFQNGSLSLTFKNFIDNLSKFNKCSIYITTDNGIEYIVSVIGHKDQVTVTENKLRLFIDDLNPQIFSDFLEIDSLSVLPLIGGTNLSTFKKISKQTNCKIYQPNILPSLFSRNSLENESGKPKIYITGLRSMVLLAKKMLQDVIQKVGHTPFIKQIAVMPIKREIITVSEVAENNCDNFSNMMYKTGCYFTLPSLGFKDKNMTGDIVSFQGNSIEEVEILIDEFMNKMSNLYCAKVEFKSTLNQQVDIKKLLNFVDTLCHNSNSFVSVSNIGNQFSFQILGNSVNLKIAINCLTQFGQYLQENFSSCNIQYQIELPSKEKDFIAGKKNGKIIKIINMSNAGIKLIPFSDNNFVAEITCSDLMDSILALGLFEDELPTILTFNVPESFHRQIIGVGGQTIQTIMRKFNVFVKFSNSFELSDKELDSQHILQSTNFQQSFVRKNNVVIKCPAKNKSQIPLAKQELEKLVEKVSKNSYSCNTIVLTNQQWKIMTSFEFNMLYNKNRKKPTNFITELEKKTNTYIKYPDLDSVSNSQEEITLEIYGIDNNAKLCASEIKKVAPYSYEFKLQHTNNILLLIEAQSIDQSDSQCKMNLNAIQLSFLNNLVVPLRMLYNVEIYCKKSLTTESSHSLVLYFYPHAFGFPYVITSNSNESSTNNVSSRNSGIPATVSSEVERLKTEDLIQIVKSDQYCQLVAGVTKFLRDWNFELISCGIIETEIVVKETSNNDQDVNRKSTTVNGNNQNYTQNGNSGIGNSNGNNHLHQHHQHHHNSNKTNINSTNNNVSVNNNIANLNNNNKNTQQNNKSNRNNGYSRNSRHQHHNSIKNRNGTSFANGSGSSSQESLPSGQGSVNSASKNNIIGVGTHVGGIDMSSFSYHNKMSIQPPVLDFGLDKREVNNGFGFFSNEKIW